MDLIKSCSLPPESLLRKYAVTGTYTDCFCTEVPGDILHALYVFSFYTSWLFKLERLVLKWVFSKPSADSEAMDLAIGESDDFAAWQVEGRTAGQILLSDYRGRTRSWLMVAPADEETQRATRLYFGSAVTPVVDKSTGRESLGRGFSLLIGLHRIYSRLLLRTARSKLKRLAASSEADQHVNRLPLISNENRPHIVIVGAGFGGLFATSALRRLRADITLIDKKNYHLFQPLLYQVATAGLAPSDIAWPIRGILQRQKNVTVLLDEVRAVDAVNCRLTTRNRTLGYDYLVLATGSRHAYFGHPEWEQHAPGLKSIDDATSIRHRVLMAFEQAEMSDDASEREKLLTFVVVGAGPTGVELAGTIAELARWTLASDFRRINSRNARVILLEAGPRILPAMAEELSHYALNALQSLGVEVRLGQAVTDCGADGVTISGESLASATVLWAAGVAASPAADWLGVEADHAGRVIVEKDLSVSGHDNLFVIGDTAAVVDEDGNPVPGIAPAAKQQGRYVADLIRRRVEGRPAPANFSYRHVGNLATIGRKAAVIEFPFMKLSGWPAWWVWGIAHIYFLIGVRSPILVALNWFRQYLTYGRGARLITGRQRNDTQEQERLEK